MLPRFSLNDFQQQPPQALECYCTSAAPDSLQDRGANHRPVFDVRGLRGVAQLVYSWGSFLGRAQFFPIFFERAERISGELG